MATPSLRYPILNEDCLDESSKGLGKQALRRVYQEPPSEGWVTWNMLQLLQMLAPNQQLAGVLDFQSWERLVSLANKSPASTSSRADISG